MTRKRSTLPPGTGLEEVKDALARIDSLESERRLGTIARDVYLLDPKIIQRRGPYVRHWDSPEELAAMIASVEAEGRIHQPIGVRREGEEVILVYGSRRLRSALAAGLAKVPVRDYADLSEDQSVLLQLLENDQRQDMHPVDRAMAFFELTQRGYRQADILRAYGWEQNRSGYLSYMVRAGEGLAALGEKDRATLYGQGDRSGLVRHFQRIAKAPLPERIRLLKALAGRGKPERGKSLRADEISLIHAADTRGGQGRTVRLRWTRRHLQQDPLAAVQEITTGLALEIVALAGVLETLPDSAGTDTALKAARAAAAALRRAGGASH